MGKKTFDRIMAGLQDALADVQGKPGHVTRVTKIAPIEPLLVRERIGMTQSQLSDAFGIPVATWRKWEQHQRGMDSANRLLLHVIAAHPHLVQDVARTARQVKVMSAASKDPRKTQWRKRQA